MEVTTREFLTLLHGMLFGGFFLMTIFGAIVLLVEWRMHPQVTPAPASRAQTAFLVVTVLLGWMAVLSGAYIVYPWYRAIPPAGAALVDYPQRFLMSKPTTAVWHSLGMEWKEHVAWMAPMAMTAVAYILTRQRAAWFADRKLRTVVIVFAATAFLAAGLAGMWGALIDKAAPVSGGTDLLYLRSAR